MTSTEPPTDLLRPTWPFSARRRVGARLRDVLDWPSKDVAELLNTSVPAVNSALQRARSRLTPPVKRADRPLTDDEARVLEAFLQAWHARDITALAALLRDDVTLSMPPQAIRIIGRDLVAEFFASVPAEGRLDLIRLVLTRANGHPALAAYLPDDTTGDCRGYGIMVLTLTGGRIDTITGFPDPALFPVFGLPDRPGSN